MFNYMGLFRFCLFFSKNAYMSWLLPYLFRVIPQSWQAFSRAISPQWSEVNWVILSCLTLCDPMDYTVQGQNTGVGSLSLLQGILPTQVLKPGLRYCRWICYQLSHKGSPRTLERVAYPFSSGSSQPRNRTQVSCIAGGFFTNWAIREAQSSVKLSKS